LEKPGQEALRKISKKVDRSLAHNLNKLPLSLGSHKFPAKKSGGGDTPPLATGGRELKYVRRKLYIGCSWEREKNQIRDSEGPWLMITIK